ncbi:MAG: hypothetical protein KBA81_01925 [Rhabdochlamydiaceae bacterium]|nr:hypothetical protein [Rhabdochlamydiaceae bacterium]
MSFASTTLSKSLQPFLSQQKDTPFTPVTISDTSSPQEVSKEPSFHKTIELDHGVRCALQELNMSLIQQAIENVPYAQLLLSFFTLSEPETIEKLEALPLELLKILLTPQESQQKPVLDIFELSALQGHFSLLRFLFNKGREIGIKPAEDGSGWSIAHFAALHPQGRDALKTIPELQSQEHIANRLGATPQDFLFWLSKPDPVSLKLFGPQYPTLTPDEFYTYTDSHYWNRPRFKPATLLYFAFTSPDYPKTVPYLSHLLGPKVDSYIQTLRDQPCKLFIKKMQGPQIPEPLKGQWECLASQDIAPGEIVALYTGDVLIDLWDPINHKHTKTVALADNLFIDGAAGGGSLAEMINHGFPNCAFFPHQYRGFPLMAVVALEHLKEGDRLFLTYGKSYFDKIGIEYQNLNQNGIDAFLAETQELQLTFLHLSDNGKDLYYCENGALRRKRFETLAPESVAIQAWAGCIRVDYLANFHHHEMANRIEKLKYPWLKRDFFSKTFQ